MHSFRADRNPDYGSGPPIERKIYTKDTWRVGRIQGVGDLQTSDDQGPMSKRIAIRVTWCCYLGPDPVFRYRLYFQVERDGVWVWLTEKQAGHYEMRTACEELRRLAQAACRSVRTPIGKQPIIGHKPVEIIPKGAKP